MFYIAQYNRDILLSRHRQQLTQAQPMRDGVVDMERGGHRRHTTLLQDYRVQVEYEISDTGIFLVTVSAF